MSASADETAPLCRCGCGEPVRDKRGGVWAQWRPGHNRRRPLDPALPWAGGRADAVAAASASSTEVGQTPGPTSVGTYTVDGVPIARGQLTIFDALDALT